MKSFQEAGTFECKRLRNRIARALGTEVISKEDHDFMRERIDEIEARIQETEEKEERANGST